MKAAAKPLLLDENELLVHKLFDAEFLEFAAIAGVLDSAKRQLGLS